MLSCADLSYWTEYFLHTCCIRPAMACCSLSSHCLVQFPYAASYPLGNMQPPIITSCLSFASNPCSSTSGVIPLGEITYDATKPTLTIIKLFEQYGDPNTNPTRKLQQNTQPLFVTFLFNFSKAGAYGVPSLCTKDLAITMISSCRLAATYMLFPWVQAMPNDDMCLAHTILCNDVQQERSELSCLV